MIVILDSGVLGLLASPVKNISQAKYSEISQCNEWLYELLAKSRYVVTSQISDYEVRRELIRIKSEGLEILDSLKDVVDFLPLTTEVMNKAAEFWAKARQNNIPTTDNKNIDADMIISAQWNILCQEAPGRGIYVATTNIKHLKIFVEEYAQNWRDIKF
ncbi:MAG: type II toxin-antitoxin system VapC family toxin [Okeania sp. SIO2C2]|uniref:type II toxin-antitoxin system VapC family toxin n=1 Tax=Okeania sp. SIO2C2 TaxID=2607787 RepID=UPI0013BC1389|nr:type II toxin-antitoxin system VapC family toxin [Okeania sp. SIO2C2]NEP91225.1 type II toxin-antitoxin system VapC family toxin [Okeania sp. SIO2C2]